MAHVLAAVGSFFGAAFTFTYGALTLLAVFIYTACLKQTWWGLSESERRHGENGMRSSTFGWTRYTDQPRVSKELWSLSESGPITHNFITLPDGPQLHYLSQRPARNLRSGTTYDVLIILLHGFPDSSYIWDRQLRGDALSAQTKLVALDLPGCGGSDDLAAYGPDQILNAVAETIAQLKIRYLAESPRTSSPKRQCILVGHDWGGALSYRIAAETVGLVDNVVILNSVYPLQAGACVRARLSRGFEAFREWFTRFYEFSKLEEAGEELGPVFSQLSKSSYIFLVTLPLPLAKLFPAVAKALVLYCHKLTHASSTHVTEEMFATSLAVSCGPTSMEARSVGADGQKYGASVWARSQTRPAGDWDQRIRLYKEGAGLDRWTPSYTGSQADMRKAQTVSVAQRDPIKKHRLEVRESEKFKCPLNIIYGLKDVALDPRITLDGIEEYFMSEPEGVKMGRIVKIPDCTHWALAEDAGAQALQETLLQLIAA